MSTKMVIVVRSDLKDANGQKIRTGKLATQVGHAASEWLRFKTIRHIEFSEEELAWMNDNVCKKICVKVPDEVALLAIFKKAGDVGLTVHLIKDMGLTQFATPTYTCVGIGPHTDNKFDGVTTGLELL